MKIYKRTDGFEVQDASGEKTIADICLEFGGLVSDWTDVTAEREAAIAAAEAAEEQDKQAKDAQRASAISKLKILGLTDSEIASLTGA